MRIDGPVREESPDIEKQGKVEDLEKGGSTSLERDVDKNSAVKISISQGKAFNQVSDVKLDRVTRTTESDKAERTDPGRADSVQEQCRVCQQESEEGLMDLGCHCRGELAKAHRSCIETWFRTRGSNKCEICQQVAANVHFPEPLPSTNYWVWRVDPAFRSSNFARDRSCYSPIWIAFSILVGGLLLDVLISISLGVSALPVNIIIGVLIVLGLGTALRLGLECCHEWRARRVVQRLDITINPGLEFEHGL
ncbi:hypothetical protein H6P81_008316 [Aristolochia fimbriata]|uniref:RING-CH-type domain-containing protein n=1 Tax=Aristolochia fimbriata TaxID=158543 RepID=A0AAV7F5Y2_ARIFI|nr:hypothetical protein H6P81_008316 [Aristolochia fimbriata]